MNSEQVLRRMPGALLTCRNHFDKRCLVPRWRRQRIPSRSAIVSGQALVISELVLLVIRR